MTLDGAQRGRLQELAATHALLGAALDELTQRQILSEATALALEVTQASDAEFAEFLDLTVRALPDRSSELFALALSLVDYIGRRSVGHDALDRCLEPERLTEDHRQALGNRMCARFSEESVVWFQHRLTQVIRDDAAYHSFLTAHLDVVVRHCFDEMAAYLLVPNRGPERLNLESFELLVERLERPAPFVQRLVDWVHDGFFEHHPLGVPAGFLYADHVRNFENPAFAPVQQALHQHVRALMRSGNHDSQQLGLYHLASMVTRNYRAADVVVSSVLVDIGPLDVAPMHAAMYSLLLRGLVALAAVNTTSASAETDDGLRELKRQVFQLDKEQGRTLGL